MSKRDDIQKKVVKELSNNDWSGIIYAATAFGKTKTIIDALMEYKPESVLWVVPTTSLRDKEVPEEFKKWGEEMLERTTIICYRSLHKYIDAYETVVLDEADCLSVKNRAELDNIEYDNIIICTATRPKVEKRYLLEELTDIVWEYTLKDGVNDGIIAPFTVEVIRIEPEAYIKNISAGTKAKPFLTTEKEQLAYYDKTMRASMIRISRLESNLKKLNRKIRKQSSSLLINSRTNLKKDLGMNYGRMRRIRMQRSELIYKSETKLNAAKALLEKLYDDERVLILTQRIDVADSLCDHAHHSNSKEWLEPFVNEEINRLSACTSLNRGKNIPELDSVFIHQCNSTEADMVQRIGRSVRWRKGHHASIYLLCLVGTQDEKWVKAATKDIETTWKDFDRY